MKSFYLLLICFVAFQCTALSQTYIPMAAKDNTTDVLSKAKTVFSSDAQLMAIIFVRATNGTVTFSMDLSTGKADNWMYELYSPSLDSMIEYYALDMTVAGKLYQEAAGPKHPQLHYVELTDPYLDSPAAVQALQNSDAKTFLQSHADAVITMAIAVNTTNSTTQLPSGKYWVFYLHSATDSITCYIDGVTGASHNCFTATALEGIPEATGYRLDQNFPNPMSLRAATGTSIRYAVAERQSVRLAVYDLLGREIAILQNGFVETGEYTVTLPAAALTTPGLYFYRLETAHGTATKRFIVTE